MIETMREFENEVHRIEISYPKYNALVTQGSSMLSVIEPNRLAIFRDYENEEEVRVGDVVVFFKEGKHIIKQITMMIPVVSIRGKGFEVQLQGTNREVSKDYVITSYDLKHDFKLFVKYPYEKISDKVIADLGGQV
jgi:hypothetical protein